jgi:hypothetical protein
MRQGMVDNEDDATLSSVNQKKGFVTDAAVHAEVDADSRKRMATIPDHNN